MTSTPDDYVPHRPDLADEIKERQEAARRRWKERETIRFWSTMLSTPVGRAEIWRILDELDAFRTQFRFSPGGQTDRDATMFNLGRSTYGFELYQQLLVVDRAAILMMHDESDPRFAKPIPEGS